jgi:hypothetical protein
MSFVGSPHADDAEPLVARIAELEAENARLEPPVPDQRR